MWRHREANEGHIVATLAKQSDSRANVNLGLAGEVWPFWGGRRAGTEEDKGLSMRSPTGTDRRGLVSLSQLRAHHVLQSQSTQAQETDPAFSSVVVPP